MHHRRSSKNKSAAVLEDEIAALKASMRRDVAPAPESKKKLSALEALIPSTSTRGRKRPRPGESHAKEDDAAVKMLNAFKARLEGSDRTRVSSLTKVTTNGTHAEDVQKNPDAPDEEATLCDLHFIANCQSCSNWADDSKQNEARDDNDRTFLSHALTFDKDRLGKDLTWKKKNEEDLVVIDPREHEKGHSGKSRRDKDRERGGGGRDWDERRQRERQRSQRQK